MESKFIKTTPPEATMAALETYARMIFDRRFVDPLPPKTRARRKEEAQDYTTVSDTPLTHNHHILPKSLYPQFSTKRWNLVRLTLQEHFHAHVLLAKAMERQIATHRALYVMTKRYPLEDPTFDWVQAEESERHAGAANSLLQSRLMRKKWENPAFRAKVSYTTRLTNITTWQNEKSRIERIDAIQKGRKETFYANPEAVKHATAAQSEKTSAEKHWRFRPVNIYHHETGELVAEHVCLTDYAKRNHLNQAHLQQSLSADRRKPPGRGNRTHSKGYFARAIDESGNVIGDVCPGVPPNDHHHARRADIYRANDDVCVARNVIVRQFCINNNIGIRFSQSALSRTANADRSKLSTSANPLAHKGYYAIYCDMRSSDRIASGAVQKPTD